jgi:hypothetical protein
VFAVASAIHLGLPRECLNDKFNNGSAGELFDFFVPRDPPALGKSERCANVSA